MGDPIRVGFTGHQGLDPETEQKVEAELRRELTGIGEVIGICSLAEGSDQLFAQVTADVGGRLIVIVPCHNYERTFEMPESLARFRRFVESADRVLTLDYEEPSEQAFWAGGKRVVEESERMVAVWDGEPSRGLGGTADVVAFAHQSRKPVSVIWPDGVSRR